VTFAVGIRVAGGLVALADTQIVRGEEISNKAKLSQHAHGTGELFVMTSGLRSVRDKVVTRLDDDLAALAVAHRRLHHVVSAFGDHLKQVRVEDGPSLRDGGLAFNAHAIIGGQLEDDAQPELYLVYPEGNWVVATEDAPSFVVGRSSYSRPILHGLLRFDMSMQQAATVAFLAFDATRRCAVDVGYPIDMVVSAGDHCPMRHHRYTAEDLEPSGAYWHDRMRAALDEFPATWTRPLWPDGAAGPTP
jgi:putative proteasome-type protease